MKHVCAINDALPAIASCIVCVQKLLTGSLCLEYLRYYLLFWPLLTNQLLMLLLKCTKSHHIVTLWFIIVLAGAMSALSQCSKDTQVLRWFVFFSHSPLEHSSHTGEQHRAAGCASWGGSGCTEEHLWYGLPEGGQTRTSTSQRYVCPSRLLQQYVYTSWYFFFFFSLFITIHGQPALVTVHIWMFYTRNQFFFSLRYV